MVDEFEARKKMFKGMGSFANEEMSNELRSKYGPKEPEVEAVPGLEEGDEDAGDVQAGMPPEGGEGAEVISPEVEALLSQMTPEQLQALMEML